MYYFILKIRIPFEDHSLIVSNIKNFLNFYSEVWWHYCNMVLLFIPIFKKSTLWVIKKHTQHKILKTSFHSNIKNWQKQVYLVEEYNMDKF